MEKVYSTNGEYFNFDDENEVLQALWDDGELEEGRVYYEIEFVPVDLAEYFDIDTILELAEERAYDEIGEVAEGAFGVSKEAAEDLATAIHGWAKKHLSDRRYWKGIGESRELKVTAEQVAEFTGTLDAASTSAKR